jgi:glycerate 2-kinase
MRILVACDSFKESCSATSVCRAIASGLGQSHQDWEIDLCPLADGGEGLLDAIAMAIPLRREHRTVTGPLGEPVDAEIGWSEGRLPPCLSEITGTGHHETVAWVESASCIGLALVEKPRQNPLLTSSYGLGQLVDHAQCQRAGLMIIGLGGTATVDGGIGLAQALGVEFPGLRVPAGGGEMVRVSSIALPTPLCGTRLLIASDVTSPLLGPLGAARAFGPQKGATLAMVEALEQGMRHYATKLFDACRRARGFSACDATCLNQALTRPGAGAAGGLGFALEQLCSATSTSGVDLVMRCVDFDERLARADCVVTGEGRLDDSSFAGKVMSGVLTRARARQVPVSVICGANVLALEVCQRQGIQYVQTLLELANSEDDAKRRAPELLSEAARRTAHAALEQL